MDSVGTEERMLVASKVAIELLPATSWLESMMEIGSMLLGGYMRPKRRFAAA
jgi:hypothetical protein